LRNPPVSEEEWEGSISHRVRQ